MSSYAVLVALDGNVDGGEEIDTQGRRYASRPGFGEHPALSTGSMVLLAATALLAAWSTDLAVMALVAAGVALVGRSWLLVLLVAAVSLGAVVRSEQSWASLEPDRLGPYTGWVRVIDDPQPYPRSTRVIVEVEGERFELWSRGRAQQLRVGEWRGGVWVALSGRRARLDAERAHRVAWQLVVGEFDLEWASDVVAGDAIARASNRVRRAIERAGEELPAADGALFRGLVVGDDRDQPREMIHRFRASGLSHLTAVSGQNVSFVLAAAGPFLRRLRPWMRWAVTLALIGWFVALTRFEPSIVRAGAMAGLSTTAYALGRERSPTVPASTARRYGSSRPSTTT